MKVLVLVHWCPRFNTDTGAAKSYLLIVIVSGAPSSTSELEHLPPLDAAAAGRAPAYW